MGLAAETQINTPDGAVALQSLTVGDAVMAASIDGGTPAWTRARLKFVECSAGGTMYWVQLENGTILLATPDQPFVVVGTSVMVRAANLLTREDVLLADDGRPLKIKVIAAGEYRNAVCDLTTDAPSMPPPGFANHFVSANGVVVGDHFVQERLSDLE